MLNEAVLFWDVPVNIFLTSVVSFLTAKKWCQNNPNSVNILPLAAFPFT